MVKRYLADPNLVITLEIINQILEHMNLEYKLTEKDFIYLMSIISISIF